MQINFLYSSFSPGKRNLLSFCMFSCIFLITGTCNSYGQIISSDRRINWEPGVPGGIPSRSTACYTDTGPLDSVSTLNTQIAGCTTGQVVQLQAGTYSLSSQLKIAQGVTVRGAGVGSTILNCTASWHCVQMGNFPSAPSAINVSGSPAKGATTITVASTTGLSIGDYIAIDQMNDGSEVVNNDTAFGSGECRSGAGTRCLGQIVKITAINNLTLTISQSLHHAYSSAQTPQIWEVTGVTTGAGLEDLTITRPSAVGGGYSNVKMIACSGCWVKNIQSNTPDFWHIDLDRVIWSTIRDSYFNDGHTFSGGQTYGVVSNLFATDNLIENNIFRHTRHAMLVQNGATGNVYGYNYSLQCYQGENWLATDMNSHGAHTTMNLFEGNVGCKVYGDNAHGSSSYNTVYRNHVTRESFPAEFPSGITQARRAIDIEQYNTGWNIVGNVLGQPTQSWTTYDPGATRTPGSGQYVYTFGYWSDGQSSSANYTGIHASTYLHGNYDYATRSTHWDTGLQDHSLPNSLYLTVKPPFFGGLPWPPIGPDLNPISGTIPAKERYEGRVITQLAPPMNLRIEP